MSPPANLSEKESNVARLLGSGSAGILELAVFHPVSPSNSQFMSHASGLKLTD